MAWSDAAFPNWEHVDDPASVGAPDGSLWLPLECWDFEFFMETGSQYGISVGHDLGIYILDYEQKVKGHWLEATVARGYCYLRTVTIPRKTGSPALWIILVVKGKYWCVDLLPGRTGKVWVHLPLFGSQMFAVHTQYKILWRNGCGDTEWDNHGF